MAAGPMTDMDESFTHRPAQTPDAAPFDRAVALADIDALLDKATGVRRFLPALEMVFQAELASARIRRFLTVGLLGILAYNSFLIPDAVLMPDIMRAIFEIQLFIVSPFISAMLWAMTKRILAPEICVTAALLAIIASVALFLYMSHAPYSYLLIYTVPVCLAFGNVVLPLPFRMSLAFTVFCIASTSLVMISRPDWDALLSPFALIVNANCAAYMLIGTYRMEASERRAFLFNQREGLRAETLAESNRLLETLSNTDVLTGLANRRHFDAAFMQRCTTEPDVDALSVLMIDIDRFKALNDTFGHDAGDRALKLVADCLVRHAPSDATVARYGGEEFIVLLPASGIAHARSCAEVLRIAIARIADGVSLHQLPTKVTVSIGLASATSAADVQPAAFIKAADQALYRAKANGRNRIEWASGLAPAETPQEQDAVAA
ncbi:GGDEF domain-containing protein [Sphingomonas sp. GB1N7]|uniref:GGDEF domain-containing protein n=1 Tax=Parasphingomonas caseinilytica TaxID=3096158 RepID=UPI002FC9A5F5